MPVALEALLEPGDVALLLLQLVRLFVRQLASADTMTDPLLLAFEALLEPVLAVVALPGVDGHHQGRDKGQQPDQQCTRLHLVFLRMADRNGGLGC